MIKDILNQAKTEEFSKSLTAIRALVKGLFYG